MSINVEEKVLWAPQLRNKWYWWMCSIFARVLLCWGMQFLSCFVLAWLLLLTERFHNKAIFHPNLANTDVFKKMSSYNLFRWTLSYGLVSGHCGIFLQRRQLMFTAPDGRMGQCRIIKIIAFIHAFNIIIKNPQVLDFFFINSIWKYFA